MLFLLSPAKTLDMAPFHVDAVGSPEFESTANALALDLSRMKKAELKKMLEISDSLADLNYERYQKFQQQPSKAAMVAFNGDAYLGLDATSFSPRARR